MKIEQIRKNATFLLYCKDNYAKGIRPADITSKKTDGYIMLTEIAKLYFDNYLLDSFSEFLDEGQYFVQLWAAHLIIEYGQPDAKLKQLCLAIIISYSTSTLTPDIALQEKKWLDNYK